MQNKSDQQKHHIHSLHQCFVHHNLSQNINLFLKKNLTISLSCGMLTLLTYQKSIFHSTISPTTSDKHTPPHNDLTCIFSHLHNSATHKDEASNQGERKAQAHTTISLQFLNKLKIKTVTLC